MMDIDILQQMINDGTKVPVFDKRGKKYVELSEPQQPNTVVTVMGLPNSVIVIKADMFRSPDAVFKGCQGECKRADFVIVADTGTKKRILCIEMKTKKGPGKEVIQQLAGAKCFIVYCQEVGKCFWNTKDFLEDYSFRFVSITRTSLPKRRTRIERSGDTHDRPEKMLKISYPGRLQFEHLAGKT
ncbi:hypothetical protein [Acidiferrobacter sp.]|jgi:hypothetical protein|uniref:hypothetical protein n=1 Tax=Acidiferrobacter sp. TaxID=1872107 RepID=UPI00261EE43B|nr:hypothetical protein [Acidiferrobacter sp.]